MRFSGEKKSAVVTAGNHKRFLEDILERTDEVERSASLLLVGGSSARHQAVRRAQAVVRMDQLASYWSHAAVILDWKRDAKRALGAEVTWEPVDPDQQVAERNAVTLFPVDRYLDAEKYPNLALATFSFVSRKGPNESKGKAVDYRQAICDAVLHPNRDRFRYRFLDWLRIWGGYTYQPHGQPNPLLTEIPVPGAGLCEYAFEAAGIDLTPGATAPNACPEILWSTLLYWYKNIGTHVGKVKVFKVIQDPACRARKTLSMSLQEDMAKGMHRRARAR